MFFRVFFYFTFMNLGENYAFRTQTGENLPLPKGYCEGFKSRRAPTHAVVSQRKARNVTVENGSKRLFLWFYKRLRAPR